jgi:two-component system, NarL family, sensor histidine kinase BarA
MRAREPEPGSQSAQSGDALSDRHSSSQDERADLQTQSQALEKANAELQRLVDYRSRFLARLAHELRNPLTSILGFTEILLNHEKLTTAQEDFCRKIQNSALQIQGSLSQLSDLARLDVGGGALSLEEFSLADVLRESCRAQERDADRQNVQLSWQADSDSPAIVSDRGKVRQVLYNFLAYAISRSPEGAVVHATLEKPGPDFVLKIKDDGEHPAEPSQTLSATPASGRDLDIATDELGLTIARRLLHVLGANLTIQNLEPRGVTVTIQFPANLEEAVGQLM